MKARLIGAAVVLAVLALGLGVVMPPGALAHGGGVGLVGGLLLGSGPVYAYPAYPYYVYPPYPCYPTIVYPYPRVVYAYPYPYPAHPHSATGGYGYDGRRDWGRGSWGRAGADRR